MLKPFDLCRGNRRNIESKMLAYYTGSSESNNKNKHKTKTL